jgi:predicted DNA-binding transcriptional regulator YafY
VAKEFGVAVRTAYRDLDFLRDQCRAPLEYDRSGQSYVLTEPTYSLPLVTLSRGELVALIFAEKVLRQYRGTPYERELTSAFRKIEQFLPEEVTINPRMLEGALSIDLGPVAVPEAEVFRVVVDSLLARRTLRIRYASFSGGKTLERRVEPYRVFGLKGDWYVAAYDHRRGEVRDFSLARIRSASPLDDRYEIPPDFRFEDYMRDSFAIEKGSRAVNVAIRFAPRQARWIRERRWHATHRIQEQLNGGCVLRMKVSGLGEVKRWVMQFGAEAEVIAPRALRDDVAREMRKAANAYGLGARSRGKRP